MRYLTWLLRVILFLVLLGFAVKNDQPVVVHYFLGYEWHTSLVVVLLAAFLIGTLIGMLSLLGNILRQHRELSRLKRDIRLKTKLDEAASNARPE